MPTISPVCCINVSIILSHFCDVLQGTCSQNCQQLAYAPFHMGSQENIFRSNCGTKKRKKRKKKKKKKAKFKHKKSRKRTLIYFNTDTQYAKFRENPLYQATKRHLKKTDKRSKTVTNERKKKTVLFWFSFYSFFCAWKIVGMTLTFCVWILF